MRTTSVTVLRLQIVAALQLYPGPGKGEHACDAHILSKKPRADIGPV
jgi:hypothetical protein